MGQQPEDQPLHRTGHQVAHLPLFEGTYRKYHRVDPSTGKAWAPEYNKDNKMVARKQPMPAKN